MLYLILVLAFAAFRYFNWSLLSAIRGACLIALLGFALFVAQPVYRMQVLHEKPGEAIAKSKFLPLAAQFIPYLNGTNLIFGGPAAGTFCGPCVHYTHYQQKLMNLYGVESTAITGYNHSALRFVEQGRIFMTDNGFWYKDPVLINRGNWSPEGSESLYSIPGEPSTVTPYLFPMGMLIFIALSYVLERTVLGERPMPPSPFRSKGMIQILPDMTECPYQKSGNDVRIDRDTGSVRVQAAEVQALEDAPDIFYHPDVGHFKFGPGR